MSTRSLLTVRHATPLVSQGSASQSKAQDAQDWLPPSIEKHKGEVQHGSIYSFEYGQCCHLRCKQAGAGDWKRCDHCHQWHDLTNRQCPNVVDVDTGAPLAKTAADALSAKIDRIQCTQCKKQVNVGLGPIEKPVSAQTLHECAMAEAYGAEKNHVKEMLRLQREQVSFVRGKHFQRAQRSLRDWDCHALDARRGYTGALAEKEDECTTASRARMLETERAQAIRSTDVCHKLHLSSNVQWRWAMDRERKTTTRYDMLRRSYAEDSLARLHQTEEETAASNEAAVLKQQATLAKIDADDAAVGGTGTAGLKNLLRKDFDELVGVARTLVYKRIAAGDAEAVHQSTAGDLMKIRVPTNPSEVRLKQREDAVKAKRRGKAQ
jgi:hypothetical protein